jgi:hypothetical protein
MNSEPRARRTFAIIGVSVLDFEDPPRAYAYLRISDVHVDPLNKIARCFRTGARWLVAQSWRGGLPHPDPEVHSKILWLEEGPADLEPGDILVLERAEPGSQEV